MANPTDLKIKGQIALLFPNFLLCYFQNEKDRVKFWIETKLNSTWRQILVLFLLLILISILYFFHYEENPQEENQSHSQQSKNHFRDETKAVEFTAWTVLTLMR